MTNSVKFTINSVNGIQEVLLTQDSGSPTTLADPSAIHAVLEIGGHESKYNITGAMASTDGTQLEGQGHYWFVTETLNLMVTGAGTSSATITLAITNYRTFVGSASAADSAALVAFIKACALLPIS